MSEHWVPAFPVSELAVGAGRTLKRGGRQVAVFRTADGAFHAVDNRCPHEGYPLAQGEVRGCVLTCAWHNFKFDLRDGRCLMGDESVRVHPVRVRDGRLFVELSDPDPELERARLLRSLERGLLDDQLGRAARDVVRLLELGRPALEILLAAARFDAARAEYGTTHALPVVADLARDLDRHPGTSAALPIMQAMELAVAESVRRPVRPLAEPEDPGADLSAAGAALRGRIEREDAAGAEALLRGALARGAESEAVQSWLLGACSDHFLGFGHPTIYTVKMFDLLARAGWQHADDLLPALLFQIVNAPRHDGLPTSRPLRRALDALEPEVGRWAAAQRAAAPPGWNRAGLRGVLRDGKGAGAFAALADALEHGVPADALAADLVVVGAERVLRFDAAIDADPCIQDGWLDVVHALTFANAVRSALRRSREPGLLRLLFHAAGLVCVMRRLDRPPERADVAPERADAAPGGGATPELDAVVESIRAKRSDEAVTRASAYLQGGGDAAALRDALLDLVFADVATRPIVVAHLIKVANAAFDEHARLDGDPQRSHPALAAVRLFASPVRERSIGRLTHEAIRFVSEGRVPERLSL